MEPNKLIKDKNKLLMAIPVILGILFLYVFFIREDGNVPGVTDRPPRKPFWNHSRKWPTR